MSYDTLGNTDLLNMTCIGWNRIRAWNTVHNVFKFLCILMTSALVIWCGLEFDKNEDVCEISFKTFHEDKDSTYPELVFLLPNRFNNTALRGYDEGLNEVNYRKFLDGGHDWDEKMLDVDFEKVSMRLEDYIIKACYYETLHDKMYGDCKNHGVIKQWNDFENALATLHFPSDIIVWGATIKLKTSIFYNGLRPDNGGFSVFFAYRNQIYRSLSSALYKWPVRNNESTKNYIMRFTLKSMEVFRRRQKKNKACYNAGDYDSKIREIIVENIGCRPIMWNTNRSEPLCTTPQSYHELVTEHFDQYTRIQRKNKTYIDPCLSIQKLKIEYAEENIPSREVSSEDDDDEWFKIEFDLTPNNFKEIKQARKYSVQGLVGNAGGYIGLCLGYALWNVPTVIFSLWNHVKDILVNRQI